MAAVARELTKLHEEVRCGAVEELSRWAAEALPRGEMVVLVGPPLEEAITDAAIAARLQTLLSTMSVRDAAKVVADELGISKSRSYHLALALKQNAGR
jgi:16S rRNA (cytidine1402-2'-O)-methyltransferase